MVSGENISDGGELTYLSSVRLLQWDRFRFQPAFCLDFRLLAPGRTACFSLRQSCREGFLRAHNRTSSPVIVLLKLYTSMLLPCDYGTYTMQYMLCIVYKGYTTRLNYQIRAKTTNCYHYPFKSRPFSML